MNIKSTLSVLASILAVVMGLSGCGTSATSKSVEYADNLEQAVSTFEQNRTETQKEIASKSEEVVQKLSNATSTDDLVKASEAWETTWSDIEDRFTKLNSEFEAVGKSSNEYFAQLDQLAAEIKNPTLKAAEAEKNRSLKMRWIQAYREAAESVGKMQSVQVDASDFQKVIASAAMRQKIERNIQDARAIAARANVILNDLAKLTAEGHKLIKS